jgi:hypothetical protein
MIYYKELSHRSRYQQIRCLMSVFFLVCRLLPSFCILIHYRDWALVSSSKGTNPIMRALLLLLHLNLINTHGSPLYIPSHWGLGLQIWIWRNTIQSIAFSPCSPNSHHSQEKNLVYLCYLQIYWFQGEQSWGETVNPQDA